MKPVLCAFAISLALGAAASGAKPPGTVVARKATTGSFAIAVVHGQVAWPRALYARFVGRVTLATILVECLVGSESTSTMYERPRAGLQRLAVKPAGADVCHVTATLYGSGRIVAEIRAVR